MQTSQTQEISAEELARLEERYWQAVIPAICSYVEMERKPLDDPEFLEAVRRIGDETAKEIFSEAMRG